MKKILLGIAVALVAGTTAFAADMPVKVTKAPPPVVSPWDLAFGAAIMNDYNVRGISNSNHKPSVAEYQELRYNWTSSLQSYLGLSGEATTEQYFSSERSMARRVFPSSAPSPVTVNTRCRAV